MSWRPLDNHTPDKQTPRWILDRIIDHCQTARLCEALANQAAAAPRPMPEYERTQRERAASHARAAQLIGQEWDR